MILTGTRVCTASSQSSALIQHPQARHVDYEYFVLDLTHDTLALPALEAYAEAARRASYYRLYEDLRLQIHSMRMQHERSLSAMEREKR